MKSTKGIYTKTLDLGNGEVYTLRVRQGRRGGYIWTVRGMAKGKASSRRKAVHAGIAAAHAA